MSFAKGSERRGEFKGSEVLFEFLGVELGIKNCLAVRDHPPLPLELTVPWKKWEGIRREKYAIDAARDAKLLRALVRGFFPSERRAVNRYLTPPLQRRVEQFPQVFERMEVAYRSENNRISHMTTFALSIVDLLEKNPLIARRFEHVQLLRDLLLAVGVLGDSVSLLAQKLKLSREKVRTLMREAQALGGPGVIAREQSLLDRLAQIHFLQLFLRQRAQETSFLDLSQRQQFAEYEAVSPGWAVLKWHEFTAQLKSFGLRYRRLTFQRHQRRQIPRTHFFDFVRTYALLLSQSDRFRLVWLDESSVSPSNFKLSGWRLRGTVLPRKTRIRYEKMMFLGAMGTEGMLAFQVVRDGFGGQLFFSFLAQLIERLSRNVEDTRPLIFFLDNAPAHRSTALLQFCQQKKVLLLFNLPQLSPLNPIEFCWGFLKRDLHLLTDYRW